ASGKRMVYRLRTALGREITATAEHPFLTVSGLCKLGELREGAHVATARMLLSASHIYWDRVTSIEPVGVRETYDLRIEKDHNFLANDFVVHNSHAASFALIAYASAYLKAHHPAAFACALLNTWPMGFYHPATVVKDAQRHGVEVRPIDVPRSDWKCTLEDGALRLGLRYVLGLRAEAAADYAATHLPAGPHVMAHLRSRLAADGVLAARALAQVPHGAWVRVAGHVIVRQRPGTAKGMCFLTLEDETGTANAVVTPPL